MNDQQTYEMLAAARSALKTAENITVILEPSAAVILIAQLQLALRHPHNGGESAKVAREIVVSLIDRLPEGARELLMRGFDPEFDI